jgi:hypothetical protein
MDGDLDPFIEAYLTMGRGNGASGGGGGA